MNVMAWRAPLWTTSVNWAEAVLSRGKGSYTIRRASATYLSLEVDSCFCQLDGFLVFFAFDISVSLQDGQAR